MRLFVALDIPDEIRRRLADYAERLRQEIPQFAAARWTRVDGLHVTLKFIGEYPEAKLPQLRDALVKIASPTFDVSFAGAEFFPNARSPRVLVAGVSAGRELAALAQSVEETCARLGIEQERRAYHPHLTLARFKPEKALAAGAQRVLEAPPPRFGTMTAAEFILFQSQLSPKGSRYTRLERFSFSN